MATTVRKHGVRSVRISDCSTLVVIVESGNVPNIEFQFGSAPAPAPEAAAPAPAETMKVPAPAPMPEAAPASDKPKGKHGFRRKSKGNAPAAEAPANSPAPAADKPKRKGGFKGRKDNKPAPLCSALRICEYQGKDSGKWHTFAIVGSNTVQKEDGKWPKGTRFVQLRMIDAEEGMIVGSPFPCRESDWATRLRNVRNYTPTAELSCGCDLCCGE